MFDMRFFTNNLEEIVSYYVHLVINFYAHDKINKLLEKMQVL